MRTIVSPIVMASLAWTAAAAAPPRYPHPPLVHGTDPRMIRAEAAWQAAAAEPDPRAAAPLWEQAASAFDAVAASDRDDRGLRVEAASAALLAWKNALDVDPRVRDRADRDTETATDAPPTPRPLPAREAALAAALTRFLALAPDSPEAPGARFLRANLLRRFEHLDLAIADFTVLVQAHRDHEVGRYAANLLLDSLNRLQRYDEMLRWVDVLRADATFVAANPDTAEVLDRLHATSLRRQAEAAERAARDGDPDGYARCGALYDQAAAATPDDGDEALFDAGVCFEHAASVAAAVERYQQLGARYPRSKLAGRALARTGALLARVASYELAATALETYATRFAGERDAADALADAIFYRRATGDLAGAERDATFARRTLRPVGGRDVGAEALVAIAGDRLARGERAAARRILGGLVPTARLGGDRDRATALGALAWDAACRTAPLDGVCVAGGRVAARIPALAVAAQRLLAAADTPLAKRLVADARFEAALRAPRDSAAAAIATARAAYQPLTGGGDAQAAIAWARLGQLAHRLAAVDGGDAAAHELEARRAFEACAAVAIEHDLPGRLPACDEGLRQLGAAPPTMRERVPTASPAAAPPIALEAPSR